MGRLGNSFVRFPHRCVIYTITDVTPFSEGTRVVVWEGRCRKESNTSVRTFKGADDTLGASSDPAGTGFVSAEGRQQLSADAIEKMNQAYEDLKAGKIVPPSNFNGYSETDFPGLK